MHKIVLSLSLLAMFALPSRAEKIEWDFPLNKSCHEGLAFSDGITGVLVWGGERELRLTVGRGDLWDHRGGYTWTPAQSYTNIVAAVQQNDHDRLRGLFKKVTPEGEPRNPYMLPLGRVVVTLGGEAVLVRGELDVFTGLGTLFLSDGRTIELASSKASRAFSLRLPKGLAAEIKTVAATDFPVYEKSLKPLGFEKARTTFAEKDGVRSGLLSWNLPADKSVHLAWCEQDGEVMVATSRGEAVGLRKVAHRQISEESVAHWQRFWDEGAKVRVPDPVLQREFDYGMYRFGAMTDPDGIPAGLQGQWLEDDRLVPWNGDYHFNINVQECYSPAYRGGHFSHLMPLFKMVLSWRPRLRENARLFCGINNGYSMPHSIDDRGVCIGGFWAGTIDHGSTAWVAAMMYRYVRYSGDVAFLRSDAYEFMQGAMNVYRAMMVDEDGRLSLPLGPSPEWGGSSPKEAVGRDPSFQLAACHRLAKDLIDAAKVLGEQPDPMWLDVERRLPVVNELNGRLALFGNQEHTASHRHHSHMAGYYPFDTIDMSDRHNQEVAHATYTRWTANGTGAWTGWCVPWASILQTHIANADAAVELLRCWDVYFCNRGHASLHNAYVPGFTTWTIAGSFAGSGAGQVMQMDGQCAAVTAVMELLAHEVNGKVEFFKGCPESWKEVSFENLALSDGRRVSGRRINGKVELRECGK